MPELLLTVSEDALRRADERAAAAGYRDAREMLEAELDPENDESWLTPEVIAEIHASAASADAGQVYTLDEVRSYLEERRRAREIVGVPCGAAGLP